MSKVKLKEQIASIVNKFKTYWISPPAGYDVTYKETLSFSLGSGCLSLINVLMQWTTLATATHMMISYFKVSTGLVWLLGIVSAVIILIRSPILSLIIDNSNSKKGKFKPFIFWATLFSAVCFCLIPYIPKGWNAVSLFSVSLPAMPVMGVLASSKVTVSLAVLIMYILLQFGTAFSTLLTQALAGVEQTISTVAQERANIGAVKNLISNLPGSIVNIIIPIIAAQTFSYLGGWNSIELYRWVFPFCGAGALLLSYFVIKGTQERVVVNKKYVAKVRFFQGVKELSKNKYFWIITFINLLYNVRILSNITTWITQYSFVTESARAIVGVFCSTILMNMLVIGMLLGPFLIKKFGKKKVLLYSNIGFAVLVLFQFFVHKNPILILVALLFQNIFGGFYYISTIMVSDILDYQQWKTGKRLEGFWQNYSVAIITSLGIFTGMLAPAFLAFAGIGFSDDISEALKNDALRNNAYKYQTLLSFICSVIMIIPLFFYDLNEKKHADYVRVLKIRAAVNNYHDNVITEKELTNLKDICDYAKNNNNIFLLDEINHHAEINDILKTNEEPSPQIE